MGHHSELTGVDARRARAVVIREAAAARGFDNGLLLAGIANAETGMSHCHSELTWACQGPYSDDCDGPVVAGAGDGPCELEQGGLGMFQFDAGTYADTLAREGDRVLSFAGNVDAAVDFVLRMVKRSVYIEGVETDDQALAFLNEVRPWNELWTPWIQTVTHYYNGCRPGVCGVYDARFQSYSSKTTVLVSEMGAELWYGREPACGAIPAAGATLDDTDGCFFAGGNLAYWRSEDVGHGGTLLWTHATTSAAHANYAGYQLRFAEAGRYRIELFTELDFGESRAARYQVVHGDSQIEARLDQAAAQGFQPLGTYEFTDGGDQWLRVFDNTGEPGSTMTRLVIDAIRITREADPNDGGGSPVKPPGSGTGGSPGEPTELAGGCGVGTAGAEPLFALVALGLGWARNRRRSR